MKNQSLEKNFLSYLKKNELKFKDKKIAIGFSGGLDSCALLDLMARFMPKNSFSIIHITHQNSPLTPKEENENWLKFCNDRAKFYDIPIINAVEEVKKTKAGWEGSGHQVRKNYAIKNYDVYFIGHHLDDLCENYFIQTLRGAGSAKVLKEEDVIKRPLLGFSKNQLKEYMQERNLNWIEDHTNKDTDIARNFWRHEILPKIEQYYPDYRKRILTAAYKDDNKNILIKDLAIVDGLNDLIKNNELKISKTLTDRRQENLFYFYFKSKKISFEVNQLKEVIKNLKRTNKKYEFIIKGQKFLVENDYLNNNFNIKIEKTLDLKLKK